MTPEERVIAPSDPSSALDRRRDAVARIASQLIGDAIWDEDRAIWLGDDVEPGPGGTTSIVYRTVDGSLYGGTAGIALFLARFGVAATDRAAAATAAGAARHALDWVARTRAPGGLLDGAAGVAIAALDTARLLGDDALMAAAISAAGHAAARPPAGWDLIDGLPGHVLAMLRLADELGALARLQVDEATAIAASTASEAAARAADQSADRLIGGSVLGPVTGVAWPSAFAEQPLCGLAHGASGAALALLEWGARRERPDVMEVVGRAAAYERSWFSASMGTWADLRQVTRAGVRRGEGASWPDLWCHGSIGIGVARLRHYELTGDEQSLAEAGVAIDAVVRLIESLEGGVVPDLSICHGLGGGLELLLDAADVVRNDSMAELARDAADIALDLVGDGPWPCGVAGGGENPSLFIGLAGIGTVLQRLDEPGVGSTVRAFADRATPGFLVLQLDEPFDTGSLGTVSAMVRGAVPGMRIDRISHRGRMTLRLGAGANVDEIAATLTALPGVRYAERDSPELAVND
jgi:lantibiotic modifying enzyme